MGVCWVVVVILGRTGPFWQGVCVKWYKGEVVGGWMCSMVGRCVVVVASVVVLIRGGCWLKNRHHNV